MVFYSLPKRLRREIKPKADPPAIGNLADELQLQIFRDIDTLSILRLRLTCSKVVPSCNTVLQERLKTLYIHPRSIDTAIKICKHPIFGQEIEEIVLLGQAMWTELNQSCPQFRKYGFRNLAVPWSDDLFRPWPSEPLAHKGQLIDALVGLPKLYRLAFAESVDHPGFNQTSVDLIKAHANKSASGKGPADQPCLADAEIIYQLLNEINLRFTSVRLDVELPFVNETLKNERMDRRFLVRCLTTLAHLTRLDISIDCGWDYEYSGSTRLYHKMIHHSRDTLDHLSIAFLPNRAVRKPVAESRLDHIFGKSTLCQLRSLQIKLVDDSVRPISIRARRRDRPTCQDFDIISLLSRHSATLSTIKFENVVFSSIDAGAADYLEAALTQVGESTKLEQISWTVNRYVHDQRCKQPDGYTTTTCRKFHCGCYQIKDWRLIELEDFEQLATRLAIGLHVEKQAWHFGKAVIMLR